MPQTNAPFGFIPVQDEGKNARVRYYKKASGSAIFAGDLVVANSAGEVAVAGASDANLIGVAAEYKAATFAGDIAVYDDPEQVFVVQASANFQQTNIFNNADTVVTTGSTALLTSRHALDSSTLATTQALQLKVIGLDPAPDNAFGSFAKVRVKINEHILRGPTAGV